MFGFCIFVIISLIRCCHYWLQNKLWCWDGLKWHSLVKICQMIRNLKFGGRTERTLIGRRWLFLSFKKGKFISSDVWDLYRLWSPISVPCLKLSWLLSTDRDETTWLASQLFLLPCCSAGHTERSQAFVLDGMRSAFSNLFYASVSFILFSIHIYFYIYFDSIMYFR